MPQDSELERRLEDGVLRSMEQLPPSQQHPGASLLSPQALSLSPEPFSSFAFEGELPPLLQQRPMSPIIDVSNGLMSQFQGIQRPLSAQGFADFGNAPQRPLSSMELDSMTFKKDVGNLVVWIGTLTTNQQRTVVDNLLSALPEDVTHYAKTRLDSSLHGQLENRLFTAQEQPLGLDAMLNGSTWNAPVHRALSPNNFSNNRPRSADPYAHRAGHEQDLRPQLVQPTPRYERRAFDITSLAQQLTQQAQVGGANAGSSSNNAAALKLSALSTINSRAQLESQRKKPLAPQTHGLPQVQERGRVIGFNEDYQRNATSVPPPQRLSHYDALHQQRQSNNTNSNNNTNQITNLNLNTSKFQTPQKSNMSQQISSPKSPAVNVKQITSAKLLSDIPTWLKTLRLHKYTAALEGIPWKELIYLSDEQLEQRGVSAMGARGKLLKAFEVVRQHYEGGIIE